MRFLSLTLLAAAAGGCSSTPASPEPGALLEVRGAERFQTFQGFGGTLTAFDDPGIFNRHDPTQPAMTSSTRTQREAIAQALYAEIGINRTRLFPGGFEPQNDNADPMSLDNTRFDWTRVDPLVEWADLARSRGLRTAWASFGNNGNTAKEAWLRLPNDACALDPHKTDELVEWLLAAALHFKEQGNELPFMAINNEPDFCPINGNPTPYYVTPDEMVQLVQRLGARLAAQGLGTKLVITDGVSPETSMHYMSSVLADPVARPFVGAIAFHSYDGYQDIEKLRASANGQPNGADIRGHVRDLAAQYGLPVWMTEVCYCSQQRQHGGALLGDYELGRLRINHVLDELTLTNVSAFDVMNTAFIDRPGVRDELVHIYFTPSGALDRWEIAVYGRLIGHFGRAVPEGSVRLAITSSESSVRPVAFARPDGKLAIVLLNNGTAPVTAAVRASGVTRAPARYSVFTTVESAPPWQAGADLVVSDGRAVVTLPPLGMVTLVSDGP